MGEVTRLWWEGFVENFDFETGVIKRVGVMDGVMDGDDGRD